MGFGGWDEASLVKLIREAQKRRSEKKKTHDFKWNCEGRKEGGADACFVYQERKPPCRSEREGTDWAATRAAPAICIYICVCVEYRHICMPTFPQTKNQRVHSRSSEVNLSGPRNSIVQ